jgi:hypothetical protein
MLLREQGTGSINATHAGDLQVDLSEESIRFAGRSDMGPVEAASWEPGPFGVPGSAPASYGVAVSIDSPNFTVVGNAAGRGWEMDATSPDLPLVGGELQARQVDFPFVDEAGSVVDYNFFFRFRISDPDFTLTRRPIPESRVDETTDGGGQGSAEVEVTLAGRHVLSGFLNNRATDPGRLEMVGGVPTLTLPVDATYSFTAETNSGNQLRFDLIFTGQLIGAAVSPRPTASPKATATPAPSPTANRTSAVGDCNGDGRVTIDELVRCISIALGFLGLETCPTLDRDGDRLASIDELLQAVSVSLSPRRD